MTCLIKFIFVFGIFLPLISTRHVQFFRRDYNYIAEFDAHYKLHWDIHGSSWDDAFLTCVDEGATLFFPKFNGEWSLVKNLTDDLVKPPNVTDIFVGIHDKFGLGEFVTIDGHPTPSPLSIEELDSSLKLPGGNCVLMDIDTGNFKVSSCTRGSRGPAPFVCKRVDDKLCPTIDQEYKYMKESKKCYKINKTAKTWLEAMKTCYMEGGVLAMLQDDEEAQMLRNSLRNFQDTKFYVGIARISDDGGYFSVTGTKFNKLYQKKIVEAQSNHIEYDEYGNQIVVPDAPVGDKECGIINNDIFTATASCTDKLPFICEMEANL